MSRQSRHALFLSLARGCASVLDVGGEVDYWRCHGAPPGAKVTLLNVMPQAGMDAVLGDARDLSRYDDGEFDVVFSNSCIGHVGGFEDQLRMAREIRRVGRRYFVQTPNHGFPIDWRTLVPGIHFLSPQAQAWWFERVRVGTYPRATSRAQAMEWATRVRNIRRSELATLFPGATVVDERVAGFAKSFLVHNFA